MCRYRCTSTVSGFTSRERTLNTRLTVTRTATARHRALDTAVSAERSRPSPFLQRPEHNRRCMRTTKIDTPERRKRSLGLGLSLLFPSTTTSTAPLCSRGYSGSLSSGLSRACYRVSLSAVSISRPERRVTSHSVEARWQIMVMVSKVLETIWACAAVSPAAPSSELGCGIDQLGQQAIDAHLRVDRCTDALRRAHGCTGTRMRRVSHLYMS